MARHLTRQPGGGQLAGCALLRDWAVVLHNIVSGTAAQLAASAKVHATGQKHLHAAAGAGQAEVGGAASALMLESAAKAVCDAIEHLEQAVVEGSDTGLEAGTLQSLQRCSLKLKHLLAVHE